MKKLTNEEKVLKFLIKKYQNSTTTKVVIDKSDLPELNLNEKDVVRAIYTLEADQKLVINTISPRKNLSASCTLTLTSLGIYHFENKSEARNEKHFQRIQFIIPVIISIICAIAAIYSAYFASLSVS